MSDTIAQSDVLSPAPILEAVERYQGTIVDLDTSQVISPGEFSQAREALAIALRQAGLASGDRVMLAVSNGPLFIATLTAILACEGSPLLVHYKTPPAELLRYARRFGVRFLACEPSEEAAVSDITSFNTRIRLADIAALCWGSFDESQISFQGPVLRGVPLHPTSGSTGLPKVALRPGFAALEEARHYVATMDIDGDDTIVAIPPMSHAYGYGMCVMVPLLSGANIISTSRFSAKLLHRAIKEFSPSILPMVPTMLELLAAFEGGIDLRQIRRVLTAGSMLPQRTAELFRTKTGITACPLYGTTETGGISVATAADGRDIDGRVGPPMDGVGVEVRRPDDSADLGTDTAKLFVRSTSQMTGYLDEQGRITNPTSEGWFETGDLARFDDDGTIHLRGRDSEVLNVFGLKVVPCEVEEAITLLPGVLEVKVYAGQHRWGTQVVKAAVAVQGNLSAADIREHCERHLVYYKRPLEITLVDALPRTATGKINREQLP